VPAGAWLSHLAGWLGVRFEPSWGEDQRRDLLVAAPGLLPRRGTPQALRAWLRVALAEYMRDDRDRAAPYPLLIEGFRERTRLMLSGSAGYPVGGVPLWSRAMVARLQLGVFSTLGRARVVSTGDPQHDLFSEHAHRFTVVLPASWVPDANAERSLRTVIDTQKPAHTTYDLCLVEPRLRVGVQSTVGLDTVVGVLPRARLGCRHGTAPAPSSPPRSRLGHDIVLACRHVPTPPAVGRVRVGIGTPLA
jgi:hypothetical protein